MNKAKIEENNKIAIFNGACANRFKCKNINKKVCHPRNIKIKKKCFGLIRFPYVECNYYSPFNYES